MEDWIKLEQAGYYGKVATDKPCVTYEVILHREKTEAFKLKIVAEDKESACDLALLGEKKYGKNWIWNKVATDKPRVADIKQIN